MQSGNGLSWKSVIVAVFCLLACFEAGYTLKSIVSEIAAWQALVYALGVGIFVAISALLLDLSFASLGDE